MQGGQGKVIYMDTEGSLMSLISHALKLTFYISNHENDADAVVKNYKIEIFFCAAGNFRPERVEAIAERYGLGIITFSTPVNCASTSYTSTCIYHPLIPFYRACCCPFVLDAEQTLDNIVICRVFSHEEQMGKGTREAESHPSPSILCPHLSCYFNFT